MVFRSDISAGCKLCSVASSLALKPSHCSVLWWLLTYLCFYLELVRERLFILGVLWSWEYEVLDSGFGVGFQKPGYLAMSWVKEEEGWKPDSEGVWCPGSRAEYSWERFRKKESGYGPVEFNTDVPSDVGDENTSPLQSQNSGELEWGSDWTEVLGRNEGDKLEVCGGRGWLAHK